MDSIFIRRLVLIGIYYFSTVSCEKEEAVREEAVREVGEGSVIENREKGKVTKGE